jgi:hypothetical protein
MSVSATPMLAPEWRAGSYPGGSRRSLGDESDGWHDGARPDSGGPITAPCSTGWCGSTTQCLVGWARPVCRTNRTVGCDEPGPCGRTRPTRGFASRRLAWVSCVPAAAGVAAAAEGASSRIRDPWWSGTMTVPAAIVTQPPPRVPSLAPAKSGPGSPDLRLADEQALHPQCLVARRAANRHAVVARSSRPGRSGP